MVLFDMNINKIMKKILLTSFLLQSIAYTTFSQEKSIINESKDLGLISYLTTVKSIAEFKMISLASDPQYKKLPDKAKSFNSEYNLIKLATDKLIHQLSADMISKNSLRPYKKINNYLIEYDPQKPDASKIADRYGQYQPLLDEIDGRLETFMMRTYSSALAGASLADFTGVAELTHTIISGARDFREKKVQSMTTLLKELKLEKLKDLTSTKEDVKKS